jgi:hypothetical protein
MVPSTLTLLRSEDVSQLVGLRLCCRDHTHQVGESLSMDAPALLKRQKPARHGLELPICAADHAWSPHVRPGGRLTGALANPHARPHRPPFF